MCGNLDGETFLVAEAMEGENFPPMHANCRCVTVMSGIIPDTRIARDPETGETYKVRGDMTFNEWKNSLTPDQKEALKYVDKSAGSGIIKKEAASSPSQNTGTVLTYNPNKNFNIFLNGYPEYINDSISQATTLVSERGGRSATEHMILVDLETGKHVYEEGGQSEMYVGGPKFWDFIRENPNLHLAFVHNHNTDGYFSETDLRTLLTNDNIDVFIASRIDGIIYVARDKGIYKGNGNFDTLYENELKYINEQARNNIITAGERTHKREKIIVDNLLKDYTEGLEVFEDGRRLGKWNY